MGDFRDESSSVSQARSSNTDYHSANEAEVDDDEEEESSWTTYIVDFLINGQEKVTPSSHLSPEAPPSAVVSDKPGFNRRKNKGSSVDSVDDALEDTASSPIHTPKLKEDKGIGSGDEVAVGDDSRLLKERDVLGSFVNAYGQVHRIVGFFFQGNWQTEAGMSFLWEKSDTWRWIVRKTRDSRPFFFTFATVCGVIPGVIGYLVMQATSSQNEQLEAQLRQKSRNESLMMGRVNRDRLAEYLGELQRKEDTNDRYVAALKGETLTRTPYIRIQPQPLPEQKEESGPDMKSDKKQK